MNKQNIMAAYLQHCSDEELFTALGSNDDRSRRAFELLYNRHGSRVYTYCRRMLNNTALAEDIFQEVFIRLHNSARDGRCTMTNTGAYLLRIARNLCLNELQKKCNATVALEEFDMPCHTPAYESAELAQLLETAMETLPEDYREALVLKEHLGLTYNEIAEVLGTTMPVVRTRIYRAKNKLKDILAPYLEDLQQ